MRPWHLPLWLPMAPLHKPLSLLLCPLSLLPFRWLLLLQKGDGSDSIAEQVAPHDHWADIVIIVAVVCPGWESVCTLVASSLYPDCWYMHTVGIPWVCPDSPGSPCTT